MRSWTLLSLGSTLVLLACANETRESETRREASYPGGYRVEVLKKDSYARYQGLISGHDYGVRHEYAYSFVLTPGRVDWRGGAAEPKALVLCPQQIYLKYLDVELAPLPLGSDAGAEAARSLTAVLRQAKLLDERYFFKLLGEQRWINVDAGELRSSASCQELAIPNDGELVLGRPVLEP